MLSSVRLRVVLWTHGSCGTSKPLRVNGIKQTDSMRGAGLGDPKYCNPIIVTR